MDEEEAEARPVMGTIFLVYSKISMRVQQCVRLARYARSLSIIYISAILK